MNSLSWLLYWADVLPALSAWMALVFFTAFAVSLLGTAFFVTMRNATQLKRDKYNNTTQEWDYKEYPHDDQAAARSFWWCPIVSVVTLLLWGSAFLVPEKETFYMIAGSEIGERAIQTPEFVKVRRVVNDFLDDKLKKDEPSSEKKEEN